MKWEYGFVEARPYKKVTFKWAGEDIGDEDLLTLLNRLGKEEWEVISVITYGLRLATLKRPL